MHPSSIGRWSTVAGLVAFVPACGSVTEEAHGPGLPEEPGFYALVEGSGDYQRLDGDREWEIATWPERSDLGPYTQFIIYDPALATDPASLTDKVQIQKVAWVRSEIDQAGPIVPASGSKWVFADIEELMVPATIVPVEGRADAAHIVPNGPLDPGLYSVQLRAGALAENARIGVQWSTVDQQRYSGANCVDRYIAATISYRPCVQQARATGQPQEPALRIHLVDPGSETVQGRPTLVIEGVVVNATDRRQSVPTLEASILDPSGATLKHWVFEPRQAELAPGQSASFRTDMPYPPPQTARVNVRFAPTSRVELPQPAATAAPGDASSAE